MVWKEKKLWKIVLWRNYVKFHYMMGVFKKNEILIEEIGVDDQDGDDEP